MYKYSELQCYMLKEWNTWPLNAGALLTYHVEVCRVQRRSEHLDDNALITEL